MITCLPPTPSMIPLRKGTPASRRAVTLLSRSGNSTMNRFHPPGSGRVPSGIAWPPPPWPLGALSTSRRSPRLSIAKVGAGCICSRKPRWLQ